MAARQFNHTAAKRFREQLESSASTFFTLPDPRPEIDVALTRMICDTYLHKEKQHYPGRPAQYGLLNRASAAADRLQTG